MTDAPARRFSKALITGIAGSGGSYLADHIVRHQPQVSVHGITRWRSRASYPNLAGLEEQVTIHDCDLTDLGSVVSVLEDVRPDIVFHIAAHASVRSSLLAPLGVLHNNIMGTANLLEAIRILKIDPLVKLCSTSAVYGEVDARHVPISEDCPMNPLSPYAVSKAAMDHLGYSYFCSYGMRVIRTRVFGYINPRRAELFATAFALQVARIEAGLQDELQHGNLESRRSLMDVRDVMDAYWVAVELCDPGEIYNVGGDTVISVGEFLDLLKQKARKKIVTREDPALLRPADVTSSIADFSKFFEATGWRPKYGIEDSVDNLLDHARREIGKFVGG